MREILFSQEPIRQRGEFMFCNLDKAEKELVAALVNWNQPSRLADLIYEAHGRSLTAVSPTKPIPTAEDVYGGNFRGLQIFGAAGSLSSVKNGIRDERGPFVVTPLDKENHADFDPIMKISQVRKISNEGKLLFAQKTYVPLHGMDKKEADNRKRMTQRLRSMSLNPSPGGYKYPFIVPEFAAEGVFPDKLDPNGDPLMFQVYRVPLLPRFPSQFIKTAMSREANQAITFFDNFSYFAGRTLRDLHENNLAYMNPHLGNMSLIQTERARRLFITDLGGVEDFSKHPYPERFKGFDIYYLLTSGIDYLSLVGKALGDFTSPKKYEKFNNEAVYRITAGLTHGYFSREIRSLGSGFSDDEIAVLGDRVTSHLLDSFCKVKSPQEFLEFFERFYSSMSAQNSQRKPV